MFFLRRKTYKDKMSHASWPPCTCAHRVGMRGSEVRDARHTTHTHAYTRTYTHTCKHTHCHIPRRTMFECWAATWGTCVTHTHLHPHPHPHPHPHHTHIHTHFHIPERTGLESWVTCVTPPTHTCKHTHTHMCTHTHTHNFKYLSAQHWNAGQRGGGRVSHCVSFLVQQKVHHCNMSGCV